LAGKASAQDPVQVAPKLNKVALDNDRVRVLDVVIKPGEKMPMHSHPDNILYVITGGKSRATDAEGKTTERTFKDGECVFRKGETHAVENAGEKEIHVLNIELKR
jgi:quercetin dioxygenase-like cupin family protein